jgi:hypothetical protein
LLGAKGLGIFANHFPAVRHAWRFLPSGLDEKPFYFLESQIQILKQVQNK